MFNKTAEFLKDLSLKLHEYYEELLKTSVKFDALQTYTKEALDSFKHIVEKHDEKIDRIERDRIRVEAELRTKIDNLQHRLDVLSEQALHQAIKSAAETIVSDRIDNVLNERIPPQK